MRRLLLSPIHLLTAVACLLATSADAGTLVPISLSRSMTAAARLEIPVFFADDGSTQDQLVGNSESQSSTDVVAFNERVEAEFIADQGFIDGYAPNVPGVQVGDFASAEASQQGLFLGGQFHISGATARASNHFGAHVNTAFTTVSMSFTLDEATRALIHGDRTGHVELFIARDTGGFALENPDGWVGAFYEDVILPAGTYFLAISTAALNEAELPSASFELNIVLPEPSLGLLLLGVIPAAILSRRRGLSQTR